MNKEAFLQETYDSAFNDELEKIAKGGSAISKFLRKSFGISPTKRSGAKALATDAPSQSYKAHSDVMSGMSRKTLSIHPDDYLLMKTELKPEFSATEDLIAKLTNNRVEDYRKKLPELRKLLRFGDTKSARKYIENKSMSQQFNSIL